MTNVFEKTRHRPESPKLTKALRLAVQRMCDAAVGEFARLVATLEPRGIREEMLVPALASAAAPPTARVRAATEVRLDGKRFGGKTERGAPKRADLFVAAGRAEGFFVELKIAKTASKPIRLGGEQLQHLFGAKVDPRLGTPRPDGILVLCVARHDAKLFGPNKAFDAWEATKARAALLASGTLLAQSVLVGSSCKVSCMAVWIPSGQRA
jgi:hypothetical protein